LGAELLVPDAVEDTASDLVNLGICAEEDAPVGALAFTDGAPAVPATELLSVFPYMNSPIPGSPN
jgi:hypothetical protein